LPHAARQLVGILVDPPFGRRDAHRAQHLDGLGARRGLVELLVQAQRLADLVADGIDRVQRGHRLLEDHRDLVAADAPQRRFVARGEVRAAQADRAALDAAGRRHQPHDRQGGHALAAAGFAYQAQRLAGHQRKADLVEHRGAAAARVERHGQALDLEYRRGGIHSRPRSVGLSASFRPSPIRLTASTVRKMAAPGSVTAHQAVRMYGRLLPIIRPQLMMFGSPSPRNDRPASNRMAVPIASVADTISGAMALGSITRQMMRPLPAPMTRSASTYSRRFRRRNSARARRAVPVQLTTPMAMAMVARVGLNRVTSTMANNNVGSTWKNSVMRISRSSTQPP